MGVSNALAGMVDARLKLGVGLLTGGWGSPVDEVCAGHGLEPWGLDAESLLVAVG